MVITIGGVLNEWGGSDLSYYLDRQSEFTVEAASGKRLDTIKFTLFDPAAILAIPRRAEIIIYDFDASLLPHTWLQGGGVIVDPVAPNVTPLGYVYGSYTYDGAAKYDTQPPLTSAETPANWTPRLFGGYVAQPSYVVTAGGQRNVAISAQDYTVRNLTTICNKAYGADPLHPQGWADDQIIRDLYATYRPDVDVTFLQRTIAAMPSISFPTHTLTQMIERVVKITGATYRVDYYKRLYYGLPGFLAAPFDMSDAPNNGVGSPPGRASFAPEALSYAPDGSTLVNRVWVVGGTYQGAPQSYQFPATAWDGTVYATALPARFQNARAVTVTINGVAQGTVGVLGTDGTLDTPVGFKYAALIGAQPPVLAFQTPPPMSAVVIVTGVFVYPLIQIVTDPVAVRATNGLIFEKVVRDKRIDNVPLAIQVAQQHLALQSTSKGLGKFVTYQRSWGNVLLQPGQSIAITSANLFGGGVLPGNATVLTALINRLTMHLTPDTVQPYEIDVEFSDRPDMADADIFDLIIGESGRTTAALEQTDLNSIVQDQQSTADTVGMGADALVTTNIGTVFDWSSASAQWGFAKYG